MTAQTALRRVRWHFDDSPLWDGFDQGTTWNGWPNLSITPEAREQAARWLETDGMDEPENVAEWRGITPDSSGLIDLSGGYAPNIDEAATACAALGRILDAMTAHKIGTAFALILRDEWLTADQWNEVRRRNATPEYGGPVCASHDFCDANMAMAEAFEKVTGREPVASFETHYDPTTGAHVADDPAEEAQAIADGELWAAAWEYAGAAWLITPLATKHPTNPQLEALKAKVAAMRRQDARDCADRVDSAMGSH